MFMNDSVHVWHVAKTGNNVNGGHAGQYPVNLATDAKLTIGAAITAAAPGDTIVVWPGTYVENVTISKSLTLLGFGRSKSIVQVVSGTAITFTASDCVLKGFSGITTAAGIMYGIFGGNLYANNVIDDCYGEGDYDGIHMGASNDWKLLNSHGKGKFDGIQAGTGHSGYVYNCVGETDGSNTIDVEVNGFVCGAVEGLRVKGLTVIANRSLNGALKHLNGVWIKGDALLSDVIVHVNHTGTGSHIVKGLSIETNTGSCLVDNIKIFVKAIEGTAYGVYVGSTSQGTINGGQVELDLPLSPLVSVCTDLTAVNGAEKKRFIDNTNPVPDQIADGVLNTWTLFWTSGGNNGESQAILNWDTTLNEFTFSADFTNNIAVGDTYELFVNAVNRVINDELNNAGGLLTVSEFNFDGSNTTGVIANLSPQVDSAGRVDVGAINGDSNSSASLQRASAVRAHKATQDKATGTITLRNFDDTADQYVMTLVDNGSSMVREVSKL